MTRFVLLFVSKTAQLIVKNALVVNEYSKSDQLYINTLFTLFVSSITAIVNESLRTYIMYKT